jgi:hypothetical protein
VLNLAYNALLNGQRLEDIECGVGSSAGFATGKGFQSGSGLDDFSRYGAKEQGAAKGYNPRRPGRLSHHRSWRSWQKLTLFYIVGCAMEMPEPVNATKSAVDGLKRTYPIAKVSAMLKVNAYQCPKPVCNAMHSKQAGVSLDYACLVLIFFGPR